MSNSFFSRAPDIPSNYDIYLGVWTNWSRGPVFGATLTLDKTKGTLLISFTAFFITIVATRFWRVACFIIHWKLSNSDHRDALYHQRQAIFRNSLSSESGLWSLIQISWAWRQLANKSLSRTIPLVLFAASCVVVFSLASGFSSSISTAIGNEVLIDGTNCGIVDAGTLSAYDLQQTYSPWQSDTYTNAASYAQQVYSPNRTNVLQNGAFVRRTLNTIKNSEATCPFKNGICRSNTSNLHLDTGLIDICNDFGINLPRDECFSYRKVIHCAPLETKGRSEQTEFYNFRNYTGYNYGPEININEFTRRSNYTIVIKDVDAQNMPQADSAISPGYGLTIAYSFTYNGTAGPTGSFYPEPDIQRADADVFIIFLSGNGVVTSEPINDPWYQSNVPSNLSFYSGTSNSGSNPVKVYQMAEAASPLACAKQFQFCRGSAGKGNSCGPLTSYNDAVVAGADISFNIDLNLLNGTRATEVYSSDKVASQLIWFLRIIQTNFSDITLVVGTLGFKSLASQRRLFGGVQGPLPDDQWKHDVTNWWNISLAALQASFVDAANGPLDPAVARIKSGPTNPGQRALCENQKILSTAHTSFSLFGLYFTYITGTSIILLSFILEPILVFVQSRWRRNIGRYKNLEWVCNETLQLQRLAYEESGQGDWSKCIDPVPVTDPDQLLAPLNISDPTHPLLSHPRSPRSSKEIPHGLPLSHGPMQDNDETGTETGNLEGGENPNTAVNETSTIDAGQTPVEESQSGDGASHLGDGDDIGAAPRVESPVLPPTTASPSSSR